MDPHPFSASPPQPIPHYRALINAFGSNEGKPGKEKGIWPHSKPKKTRFLPAAETKQRAKIFCALKTVDRNHTVSRFRAFARLRARTRLPVGLAMRLRNPWLRERLRFDG